MSQVSQEVENFCLDGNIERRRGFIQQKNFWLENEGACDRDALALSAAKLMRIAKSVLAAKANLTEGCHDALLGVPKSVYGDGSTQCLIDRMVRMKRSIGILEHHLEGFSRFSGVPVRQCPAVDDHGSFRVRDQARDGTKDGGFAGTGFADQAKCITGRNAMRCQRQRELASVRCHK